MDRKELEHLVETAVRQTLEVLAARGYLRQPQAAPAAKEVDKVRPSDLYHFVDESAVRQAARKGCKEIKVSPRAVVTPLARDTARDLGLEIVREGEGRK